MSEPAFPHKCCRVIIPDELKDDPRVYDIEVDCVGLSKREYAAIHAMQGLLANPDEGCMHMTPDQIAQNSCFYADALILELGKPNEKQ